MPIQASRISLPDAPGKKLFTDLLPGDMAMRYATPTGGVVRSQRTGRLGRVWVGGTDYEYSKLVRRLLDLGMVRPSDVLPRVLNG